MKTITGGATEMRSRWAEFEPIEVGEHFMWDGREFMRIEDARHDFGDGEIDARRFISVDSAKETNMICAANDWPPAYPMVPA